MIGADLGRAALLATVPACYALHALTLAQLYLVTFAAGTLSILFNVCDGTLFVSIVAPGQYVDGQSLIYGSRALSRTGGPSIGGLLVQVLTAPLAVLADALSFLGSAFFLSRIRPPEPLMTKRIAARIGVGRAYVAGCLAFTAPLMLVPLARSPLVLEILIAAEFLSGYGMMMLDISIGAIFAAAIPDSLRSRVTGAFQAVNYGTRPLGALLGGLLGATIGIRPALWVATAGGVAGALLMLPSPLPGYQMTTGPQPLIRPRAAGRTSE